jgi:tetratricopeptide (TPR) repeat protein
VLQGASSAEIRTADGKTYPIIDILAEDEQSDLIRISVDIPSKFVYPLSLSKTIPEIGESIIVYGSPLGLENTVSDGIVSAIRDVPDFGKIIQITAPISPGSSGSPVLNLQGEVIGIATFQIIEGQNLNFAIPSERIANLNLKGEKLIFTTEELFEQESRTIENSEEYVEAYKKAIYFMGKEEYDKALSYLEIAIKINISSLKELVYHQIGFCNEKLGDYMKAIENYKQVIRINPNNSDAYCNLGDIYGSLHLFKLEEARGAYEQSICIDPNNAGAYDGLGNVYLFLGLCKESVDAHKQAIRIDPERIEAYNGLGCAYIDLGLFEDAIETFKQAIRINPDYAYVYYNLGRAYINLGFDSEVIETFKQAIRIDPDLYASVSTYLIIGSAYNNLGLYKDAIEAYKQAIRIDPDFANPHFGLGYSYVLIGDKSSALNEYKILKELDIDLANKLFDYIWPK